MRSRWYGSVQNRLLENSRSAEPEVGMGATECCWSDREPYEVIEVTDSRHIKVRALKYRVVKGSTFDGSAEYEYESDPDGFVATLFKKKNGKWVRRIGRSEDCNGWIIGFAERYYDPSF